MTPFVKWAGGKKQIINRIIELIKHYEVENADYTFYEPFVGGGVVFLSLKPKNVVINDLNSELINTYKIVRDRPNQLMKMLDEHKENYKNIERYYYQLRAWDRPYDNLRNYDALSRAARTIFLNKTCYNGLYRVNLRGEFNTPEGKYLNPTVYSRDNILAVSEYLRNDNVKILNNDYKKVLKDVKEGDIVYLDPPYHYEKGNGFTSYQKEGFTFENFVELKRVCDECIKKEATVIISNNETTKVLELFEKDLNYAIYQVNSIKTNRMINSNIKARKTGKEVIIVGVSTIFPQANSIEKIIDLIEIHNEEDLKIPEKIHEILNYSPRQNHYYLAALQFIGIVDSKKNFTGFGKILRNLDDRKRNLELAKKIVTLKYFSTIYEEQVKKGSKISLMEVSVMLRGMMENYNSTTITRRASTVIKWLDWCNIVFDNNYQ